MVCSIRGAHVLTGSNTWAFRFLVFVSFLRNAFGLVFPEKEHGMDALP